MDTFYVLWILRNFWCFWSDGLLPLYSLLFGFDVAQLYRSYISLGAVLFLLDSLPGKPLPTFLSRLGTSVTFQWNSFSSCCLPFFTTYAGSTPLYHLYWDMFTSLLAQGEFWPIFLLFSQGFLSNTGGDFLWSISTLLGTSAQPHSLGHSKGKSMWGAVKWKQSLWVGAEVNCWVPTWQSAGFSGRKILYRCSCQWWELLPLSWDHAMFCRLGGLRMKIQRPFIFRMPAPCHGCPLLKIFFSLHGFSGFGPSISHFPLCSHLHPFYLSSPLIKRIFIFQAMFHPLQEFTMSSRLKSLKAALWRRKTSFFFFAVSPN